MKKIKKIKRGFLSRNFTLTKYALRTGFSFLKENNNPQELLEKIIGLNPQKFVEEISHFKGSITKAGQLLSQYGEYYLSDEINQKLKFLQNSTSFLDLEKLKDQLPPKVLKDLVIDPQPIAAASIGQVHVATSNKNNQKYAIKIQYQGIEKTIDADIKLIKFLVKGLKMIPSGIDTHDIFDQIKLVLQYEMDYHREKEVLNHYRKNLKDKYYYIPKTFDQYSNQKVLTMEYIEGRALNEINIEKYSLEKRSFLGQKIFELFLKEIFELKLVQTDAHGGNYLINPDLTQLYLLDFGACLDFDDNILNYYQSFLIHCFHGDQINFLKAFDEFIQFSGKELKYDAEVLWNYIYFATSPLRSDNYDWGSTTLPDELLPLGKKLRKTMKFKSPPAHFIFLDRKVMGIFSLMRKLKARFNVKEEFQKFI